MSGCAFSDGFDSGFEVCAAVAVAPATKGRRPRQISIASKSVDLLKLPLDDLVETHILLAGSTSAVTVTHPALALVERTSSGLAVAMARTEPAGVFVDRVGAGVARAMLRSDAAAGIINDDLEVLYLAGVL